RSVSAIGWAGQVSSGHSQRALTVSRGDSMSDFDRRNFLTDAAAFAAGVNAALISTTRTRGGDPSFMNNVPDPLLAGQALPTFKFALEKSHGKVIGNSFGK